MVFNQNGQPFSGHMSDQFAYEHERHLAYDDQLSPFAEDSACEAIPSKSQSSDEEQKGFSNCHKDFENVTADPPYDNLHSDLNGNPSFSWMVVNNSEVIWSENGKRLFCDDETCLYARKHSKQLGSFEDNCFPAFEKPPLAAAAAEDLKDTRISVAVDAINQATTRHCVAQGTSREAGLDTAREPSHHSYMGNIHQAVEFDQVEEICSPVFDYFKRKHVAIGVNHQVDIPEWRSNNHIGDYEDFASTLPSETTPPSSNHVVDEVESDRWVGTCAMPLPESALLASNVLVLQCKDCGCPDEGSIRCVRQHVMETREKLKKQLGQDKFIELGFGDMGEVVAQKWTEEEEQLFHEIVLSNPASLGKNFWDKLPQVFPTRSSKELVSYYFNVFMLQKRAKQNRLDPLHVDSDDDEWQESHHGEFATGEDEDSVVESPLEDEDEDEDDDDAGEEDETEEEEISETADDIENCDFYALARNNEKGTCGAVKGCISSQTNLISNMQFTESSLYNCTEEQDIQDDSCTSFEGQHNGSDSCDPLGFFDLQHGLNADHDFCKEYQNDSLSRLTDDGFYDGHCDPKAWDMSYSCGAEKDDFLSTNNLIEEVFGKEPGDAK
ncbi:uncharacterized protein LOC135615372 [Musa acuminata AAA Group]|uniref:uncharacterized protein LOC135615372 n=1 Tax=Musa acuminata AAA Group TaxID=214697 RepID=UPI0031D77BD9